ncbi:2-C-methyl-D-erythritol 4-phosphate cytidylyltransferase [Sulfurisoma sediminicola]|uniref:2-C-methyl-D-erythritol 4-phosphate cytidylyltransferase n=1 Tax=Sulfurisoma sediminicola TaxID=1381557 RepID=A0A497XCX7_9PROT|nr:2-C-methyl-D-erythritol 4-phosphate cytidylyltransferase [Sulfurisoma sediminicola]RLJ64800.1 2-C-methyl-D-erythritol 4-phosphate cytidylyltransferase [Sulfurisoma sediminicola]
MSYFALVPAAGSGSRMGRGLPKQYLPLAGRPLIFHALATLAAVAAIEKVFVVLAPDDAEWQRHDWSGLGEKVAVLRCGGDTRAASVTQGLRAVMGDVAAEDWVLVHDAARACLAVAHVEALIREAGADPVGGILAVPVADTLKQAGEAVDGMNRIAATVPREGLWQAQTPQMFRHGMLLDALEFAPVVTDEASAIEALGLKPRLVPADATNFKVTYPLDLHLAELILASRSQR